MDYDYLAWWAKLMMAVVAVIVLLALIAAFLLGKAMK